MSEQASPLSKYAAGWLSQLDGRTIIAQDLRQRHTILCNDLGGIATLSYQQQALIDRLLFIEYWLQREELKLANGDEFNSGTYTQSVNTLAGLINKLGLQRQRKEVSLNQYIGKAK
jgi:hypothetical protein